MKKLLFLLLFAAAGLQGWADEPGDYLAIVGGATKAGWPNSPNAENRSVGQMVKTGDHTWVWVGELKTGEGDAGNFKFSWTAGGWDGYWANSDDLTVGEADTKTYTLSTNSANDVKYHVNSTGIYRITIYTNNTPQMKVEKLAEPTMENGYYQIGTEDEFMWFAGHATSDGATAKAKLTGNLDFSSTNYFPIGCETYKFQGELDGNGKSITLGINSTSKYQGLIGHATGGATIKNIVIKGSITGAGNTAALIGEIKGGGTIIINQVGCEASVYSNVTCVGAFVGNNWGWSTAVNITNSYNTGNIKYTGSETNNIFTSIIGNYIDNNSSCTNVYNKGSITGGSGQFADAVGRTEASYTNCYTTTNRDGSVEGLTQGITNTQITLGELCYKLNNNTSVWKQKIGGEKGYPNFGDTEVVYQVVANTTYSNLTANDGKVQIDDAADLVQFSAEVKAGNTSMDAELTADIDMASVTDWTPIGQDQKDYKGHFNGQGHRIKNLTTSAGYSNQALFGQAVGPALIENVIIDSSCTIQGVRFVAGIIGFVFGNHASGVTVRNCGNEANVQGSGENNESVCAGIVACSNSGEGSIVHIENCYNTGSISGQANNAGICAWMGHASSTMTNCYNIGSVSNGDPISRGGNEDNCTNNYSYSPSAEEVTSGELCVALGSAFTQDLSGDNHPTFGSKTVTAGKWFNETNNDVYYNFENGNYTVYQLNFNDASTTYYAVPANVTATNVKMTTTLHALTADGQVSRWNTFCSPIALPTSSFSAVKKLTSAAQNGDNYTMTFSDEADYLEAGKPYMVQVASSNPEFTATNVSVANAASTFGPFNGLTFNGTFTNGNAPMGSFIISNNVFYNVDSTVALKAFRGYITTTSGSGVKALTFDFDDDATAIEMVNGQSSMVNGQPIYNLAGQRINKMQKGINIVNGKKILK